MEVAEDNEDVALSAFDGRYMDDTERLLLQMLRSSGRDDWAAVLREADELLARDPQRAEALFCAGTAFLRSGMPGLAVQVLNIASQVVPDKWQVWNNLACALQHRHPEEALAAFERAHEVGAPGDSIAANMTNVLSQLGRHEEALKWAKGGPDAADVHYNAMFALMSLGRWGEGWDAYAKAAAVGGRVQRNYHAAGVTPRWNPRVQQMREATVVVHGEQGIGDEILFASMLSQLESRRGETIIECDARLAGLFSRSFPWAAVYGTRREASLDWLSDHSVDAKMEMGGLGQFFARQPFRRGAFLTPDPQRAAMYKTYVAGLGDPGALRVGLAWTGGDWETGRARRSVPFDLLTPLIKRSGIEWVNLEYEDRTAELEMASRPIHNPHWAARKGADMDDLAALVSNLDLVIAPTTSVVDLCGALGVPVWVMVDPQPQWRYARAAGADKMWFYESARCFRSAGDWAAVVASIGEALDQLQRGKHDAPDSTEFPGHHPSGRHDGLHER